MHVLSKLTDTKKDGWRLPINLLSWVVGSLQKIKVVQKLQFIVVGQIMTNILLTL